MEFAALAPLGVMIGSAAATTLALWAASQRWVSPSANARRMVQEADNQPTFLFEGSDLIDATKSGWRTFRQAPPGDVDLDRLISLVMPRFPSIRRSLEDLTDTGQKKLSSLDGAAELELEVWDGLTRISLRDVGQEAQGDVDLFTLRSLEDEVQTLRAIGEDSPFLIWQTDPDGTITWANSAYLALDTARRGPDAQMQWPPEPMFDPDGHGLFEAGRTRRMHLEDDEGEITHWFDVISVARGIGAVHFATSADDSVKAQQAQRNFVQTLTKTFAHLSIGLAIFDRDRNLALFNPALLDLLSVPVEFLSQRPSLVSFLDRLREDRMIPEPKNYKAWRGQIAALEAGAVNGTFCENWSLAGGLTYRITGRPHPDGAIAFLFEDISAEVSITRRFRAEIELNRAVIDAMPDAVAVFRNDGILTMTNAAYGKLWGQSEDTTFVEQDINDVTSNWEERAGPSPIWGDIREFVRHVQDRSEWSEDISQHSTALGDGPLACRVIPLPGGDTMVSFRGTLDADASANRPVQSASDASDIKGEIPATA